MKLEFLENHGKVMSGGGFINKLLHLNRPEKNFSNLMEEITGKGIEKLMKGKNKRNNSSNKFRFIPASKTKDLHL